MTQSFSEQSAGFLKSIGVPQLAGIISTGSGQRLFYEGVELLHKISYQSIPFLTDSQLEGHDGFFYAVESTEGYWGIWSGRRHFYQGFNSREITFYLEISHHLGARNLVCVNAAGGLHDGFEVGDLVLIERYLNFIPIEGMPISIDGGPVRKTSSILADRLQTASISTGIIIKRGGYVGVPGPTYETEAEVKWLRKLGCDMVGMSTTPELIRASELGMEAIALSQTANVHGTSSTLTHQEVVQRSRDNAVNLNRLLMAFLNQPQ